MAFISKITFQKIISRTYQMHQQRVNGNSMRTIFTDYFISEHESVQKIKFALLTWLEILYLFLPMTLL
jgi:hypothetical protein